MMQLKFIVFLHICDNCFCLTVTDVLLFFIMMVISCHPVIEKLITVVTTNGAIQYFVIKCHSMFFFNHIMRKLVFGVSDQVQHKTGCLAPQKGERLEISDLGKEGLFYLFSYKGPDQLFCFHI